MLNPPRKTFYYPYTTYLPPFSLCTLNKRNGKCPKRCLSDHFDGFHRVYFSFAKYFGLAGYGIL